MFKLFQFSVLLASFLLIASSVSALETSVKPAVTSMEAPSSYMLVGNSYTYYSGGLNGVINGLIEAAGIKVKRDRMVTIGGAGLGWFNVWELVRPSGMASTYVDHSDGGKIKNFDFTKEKVFDAVILQDNSRGFIQPQRQQVLKIYVKQHAYDLRCFGIQPLIMMTWARKNKPEMTAQLAEATTKVANEANAMVVPVGLAFAEAIKADFSVELYRTDTTHPSPEGTYLAACVTFATMFHRSPVGLKYYGIEKVDPKTAEFLQKVAWQTVCEFFGWQK
ncbi:SGNH/GDSL hydrolase family protein [Turicimonas muris]|uniref:SGNH/GDSL hydrolase family protein n=1 Tax=Turicimonas muris TaxID=1796652 RepID=UPI0024944B5F|nr:SGNH/GDSL hydrolase family protein [Turicimonas muris]